MDYEKSYKGLVLFFAVFLSLLIGLGVLAGIFFEEHMMRVTVSVITHAMTALMLILSRNERIYWLNAVEYEKARDAGSERRKKYAQRLLKKFARLSVLTLAVTVLFSALGLPQWIDFTIGVIALAVTAISTVTVEL